MLLGRTKLNNDIMKYHIFPFIPDWKLRISLGGYEQEVILREKLGKILKVWKNYKSIKSGERYVYDDYEDESDNTRATFNYDFMSFAENNNDKFEHIALWYAYCYEWKYLKEYPEFAIRKLEMLGHPEWKIDIMNDILNEVDTSTKLGVFRFMMKAHYEECLSVADLLVIGI
jgi:hypothetical protein